MNMAFVLTSILQFNILDTLYFFKEFLTYGWLEIWDNLIYSQCKVASLLWFAHFGMKIFAEVLNY